jgi:choice-of-anchor A domain-containing protein
LGGNSAGGAIGGRPSNFIFYGMPNLSDLTTSGTSDFIGAIYAPSANATLNSGSNTENIFGSVIARSVTVNGRFLFHFDENFINNGPFHCSHTESIAI